MATIITDNKYYTDIANTIRKNNGDFAKIYPAQMSDQVQDVFTYARHNFLNLFFNPRMIYAAWQSPASEAKMAFSDVILSLDGYVRFYANSDKKESYLYLFKGNTVVTGQFVVIKYRIPTANRVAVHTIEFYSGTQSERAKAGESATCHSVYLDNQWHTIVFDMTKMCPSKYLPNEDGTYTAKYMRFDVFNKVMGSADYCDIAYIGFSDSLEKALAYCGREFDEATLATVNQQYGMEIGTKFGVVPEHNTTQDLVRLLDGTLTSLEVPAGTTKICAGAFYGRTTLKSVVIPNSVTSISAGAFTGCTKITDMTLPSYGEEIAQIRLMFGAPDVFESGFIPSSLQTIKITGGAAIQDCGFYNVYLNRLELPSTITRIEGSAFFGATIKEIYFDGTKEQWNNIYKAPEWDFNSEIYTIVCTNGTITKG